MVDLQETINQYIEATAGALSAGVTSGNKAIKPSKTTQDQYTPAQGQPQIPVIRRIMIGGDVGWAEEDSPQPIFTYMGGDGARYWDSYSARTRARLEQQMVDAGLLREGSFIPGSSSFEQHEAWESVLGWANYYGVTPFNALARLQREGVYKRTHGGGGGGGGGGAGARTVTTIPDYPTLAQRAKEMLRNTVGREVEDWEMKLVADEMQKQYRAQSQQMLDASLAGSGEFQITDPETVTQAFIEDKYRNELDRLTAVGQQSGNYKLAVDVLTKGSAMIA